jgi:archaellum component FlaC
MKRKKVRTANDVKVSIEGLQKRLGEALKESEKIDEEAKKLREEIERLQSQCPHKKTTEKFVQDGAEMKLHTFCTDCGARC